MNEIKFGLKLTFDGREVAGGLTLNREQLKQFADEARRAAATASGGFDGIGSAAKKSADEVERASARQRKAIKDASGQSDMLGSAIKRVGAYAATYFSVNAVIGFTRALVDAQVQSDKLKNSFAFSTGSSVKAAQEIEYLRKTAYALGLDLGTAGAAYAKLQAASNGTALAGDKARQIFEAVAKASTVMGLSAEESAGALQAIQQMMSKGTVQAEELRGQLGERIPGAFQIAARAMGVTTAELGKMLEQGQVIAADFLPRFAAELEKSLGDAPAKAAGSMTAAINRMSSAWLGFRNAFNDTGALSPVAGFMERISAAMRGFADGVADARRRGWNGAGQFFAGIGGAEAGALGIETNPQTVREDQIKKLYGELARARLRGSAGQAGDRSTGLRGVADIQAELMALQGGRIKLPSQADLKAEAEKTLAGVQQGFVDVYARWESELGKHLPAVAARKAIKEYEKEFAILKTTNPQAYSEGLRPLQKKLADAVKAEGADAFAISAARLEAEQTRLKAWHDEYSDVVKRSLADSALSYQDYWALIDAGERRLAEEQLRLAEARSRAAAKRGDQPEVIKLQGEIDALRGRLSTGISADAARGLAGDESRAQAAGSNAAADWGNADSRSLAQAAAWRRESLSLLDQELAAAREKSAQDLHERQAQLDKNEALRHAPELLAKYKRQAQETSAATLAGIEAEIRARNVANESWEAGWKKAAQAAADANRNAAAQARSMYDAISGAMVNSIATAQGQYRKFIDEGKSGWVALRDTATAALRDIGRAVIDQIVQIQARKMAAGILDAIPSDWGKWLSGASGSGSLSAEAAAGLTQFGIPFAAGGAAASADLARWENSVVTRPTLFAFAKGVGLMGEKAGSPGEAIMPLSRMADGDLGVKVQGGGGDTYNISVAVDAAGGRVQGDAGAAGDLGRRLAAAVRGVLIEEKRPGGLLTA